MIVLTAKSMRPDLRVVARLNDVAWHDRLVRAGADLVLSPYQAFGTTSAAASLEPGDVLMVIGPPDILSTFARSL